MYERGRKIVKNTSGRGIERIGNKQEGGKSTTVGWKNCEPIV